LERAEVLFYAFQKDYLPLANQRFELSLEPKKVAEIPKVECKLIRVYEAEEDSDLLLIDMNEAATPSPTHRPPTFTRTEMAHIEAQRQDKLNTWTNEDLWELICIF
jgi:hypothetical protein